MPKENPHPSALRRTTAGKQIDLARLAQFGLRGKPQLIDEQRATDVVKFENLWKDHVVR